MACPLLNRVHISMFRSHHGAKRMPQDVRVGKVRCDSHGQRVLAKQSKELHPGHGSALLGGKQDSGAVLHAFAEPGTQREYLVENWFSPVTVKTLDT